MKEVKGYIVEVIGFTCPYCNKNIAGGRKESFCKMPERRDGVLVYFNDFTCTCGNDFRVVVEIKEGARW